MLIKCPSCSKANDLNLDVDVNCGHCKASLRGHTYGRIKKSVVAVVLAFSAGAFVTKKIGDHTVSNRYSIKSEYVIVELCLNSSLQALGRFQYQGKKEDCTCALAEVQKSFSVKDFNEKTTQYLAAFDSAARACKASRAALSYSG